MAVMSDAALAVGSDTALVGVSASSSAEAITGLYKAGLSTSEIFGDLQGYLAGTAELGGALRASVDLAAASELDMVQASELAAITLATFGGEMETEAERAEFVNSAMNNFVQTADASVASVGDLQAAFVNVGPSAAAMGLGVEEVNVALGILSTRGITGSEAGTALKSMLVNLQRTTPEVTETLDALGVSLYDAEGVMYSLPEIIGQLEGAMAGMTEEQRQQTTVTLAGSYGMNAMNALLGEGVEGWEEMTAAVGNAATMQETAAARANTLAGAQEALAGVWETFQIQVGTALIPVLTALADIGASLLEKYGPALTAVFETVGGVVGGLIANLQEGMSPIDAFIEAIWDIAPPELLAALVSFRDDILPGLVSSFEEFVEPIAAAVAQFFSFKDVLLAVGLAIGGVLLWAIAGIVIALAPVLLVVGGVIAVIALLRNAWENNWGGIQEKVAAVIGFIVPLVQGAIAGIQAWWAANGASILASAQSIWAGVVTAVSTAVKWIQTNVMGVVGAVISWWNANWPTIQNTIQTVWGLIQSVISSAITAIRPAIEQIVDVARGAGEKLGQLAGPLQELWAKVGPFIQTAATVIGGILTALVGVVVGIVRGIGNALGPFIDMFVDVAGNVVRIVGGIIEFLTGFFQLLIGLFTGNGERVKEAWNQMVEGIKDVVGGLVGGVVGLVTGLVKTVIALVAGFVRGIVDFFKDLYDRLVGHSIVTDLVERIEYLWDVLWERVGVAVQRGVELIKRVVGAFVALFKGDWEGFRDAILDVWEDAWDGVTKALEKAWDVIEPIWEAIRAWAEDTIPPVIEELQGIFEGVMAGISAAIEPVKQVWDGFVGAVQGFWEWIKNKVFNFEINLPALPDWAIPGSPLPIHTAWKAFADAMPGIGERIASGFLEAFEGIEERGEALFDVLDGLSGLGGGFGKIFKAQKIDPIKQELDEFTEAIVRMGEQLGLGLDPLTDPMTRLILMRMMTDATLSSGERNTAQIMLSFMEERGRLMGEYNEQQERLLRLQEQQAKLDFLGQQLDLLKLIRDNGLDASLLEGLTLGLEADAGQLMDAMTAAMQALIKAAEDELGIHSPSRWAIDTMRNLFGTMVRTAEQEASSVRNAVSRALAPALAQVAPGTGGQSVDNSRRATNYGGYHVHVQGNAATPLETLWEMAQ